MIDSEMINTQPWVSESINEKGKYFCIQGIINFCRFSRNWKKRRKPPKTFDKRRLQEIRKFHLRVPFSKLQEIKDIQNWRYKSEKYFFLENYLELFYNNNLVAANTDY